MDPTAYNSSERPPATLDLGTVTLERWSAQDREPLFAAVSASLDHLRPWMAFAAEHSRDSVARFLADSDTAWERGEHFRYAIRDTRGELAGSAARKLGTFAAEPKAPADVGRDVHWRLDAADFAASRARALLANVRAHTEPAP